MGAVTRERRVGTQGMRAVTRASSGQRDPVRPRAVAGLEDEPEVSRRLLEGNFPRDKVGQEVNQAPRKSLVKYLWGSEGGKHEGKDERDPSPHKALSTHPSPVLPGE